jgi:hypothetical protein
MEDLSKIFVAFVETTVKEVERFFTDIGVEVNETFDAIGKISEEITQEMQNGLNELEEDFNDMLETLPDLFMDLDIGDTELPGSEIDSVNSSSFVNYVYPSETEHPACRGCVHYHGYVYNGNLLVCGMYPSGVESDTCADWESENNSSN